MPGPARFDRSPAPPLRPTLPAHRPGDLSPAGPSIPGPREGPARRPSRDGPPPDQIQIRGIIVIMPDPRPPTVLSCWISACWWVLRSSADLNIDPQIQQI